MTPPDRPTDDGAEDDGANCAANGQAAVATGGRRLPTPTKRSLRKGAKRDNTAADAAKKKAASKRRKSARIAQMQRDRENAAARWARRAGGGRSAATRRARGYSQAEAEAEQCVGPGGGGEGEGGEMMVDLGWVDDMAILVESTLQSHRIRIYRQELIMFANCVPTGRCSRPAMN